MTTVPSSRIWLRILHKYNIKPYIDSSSENAVCWSASSRVTEQANSLPQPPASESTSGSHSSPLTLTPAKCCHTTRVKPSEWACSRNPTVLHFQQQQHQAAGTMTSSSGPCQHLFAAAGCQEAEGSLPLPGFHIRHSQRTWCSQPGALNLPIMYQRCQYSSNSQGRGRKRIKRSNSRYKQSSSSEHSRQGSRTGWLEHPDGWHLEEQSAGQHHHGLPLLDREEASELLQHSSSSSNRSRSVSSRRDSSCSSSLLLDRLPSRWLTGSSSNSSAHRTDVDSGFDKPPRFLSSKRWAASAAAVWDHAYHESSSASSSKSSTSRDWRPWPFSADIQGGNVDARDFVDPGQILTSFYTEGSHGGLGRRFRRKVPLFEVIEYHANGTAVEQYKPRTPQQLGLHPRDVVLFAPISRLAAPQRATIVVHDGKILVKTEIAKAIITAEKAIIIKGRRDADTQKLSQNILAANDQRLMAISMYMQQLQQEEDARASQSVASLGCGKAPSAAEVIKQSEHHTARTMPPRRKSFHDWDSEESSWLPKAGGELKDVPFEMLVLEVLLDATTEYFYTKVQHLNWMLESIAADIRQPNQPQGAMDKAHQLIPIQKFLTSVKNDVKETSAAIKAALESNETLQELCLSWHLQQQQQQRISSELAKRRRMIEEGFDPDDDSSEANYSMIYGQVKIAGSDHMSSGPGHQVRMLTEMLESYEREIQSLEGSINEAEEDLDNTRALWHMQLDSSRNHIIMVNLWLSMLNISVMASTILPAFFGMNLEGPLSGTEGANFFLVCGGSIALAALSYPASRYWYTSNWKKINQNRMFEQKMLRVLLVQHIEDLDAISRAARRVRHKYCDRRMFRQMMQDALGSRAMTPAHMDFLWQCYDRDRDGFLAEAELIKPLNTYHTATEAAETHPVSPDATSTTSSSRTYLLRDLLRKNSPAAAATAVIASSDNVDVNDDNNVALPSSDGYFAQVDEAHEQKLQSWENLIASESTRSSRHRTQTGSSSSSSSSSSTTGSSSTSSSNHRVVDRSGSKSSDEDNDDGKGNESDEEYMWLARGGSVRSRRRDLDDDDDDDDDDDHDSTDHQEPWRDRSPSDSDGDNGSSSSGGRKGGKFRLWMNRKGGSKQQQQPEQQQQPGKPEPQSYPGSWMDDPRFTWD